MATGPISPAPRRFLKSMPRPMWIGLAAIVLLVGYAGFRVGLRGYQRRTAVREIEHFNGSIQYLQKDRPAWLLTWISEDRMQWFDDPDHVVFWPDQANLTRRSRFGGVITRTVGPLVNDENLTCVLGLPNLKSLDLAFSGVSDVGVKHLIGLRMLESLRLEGSDVSDESIPALSQMRTLKVVNVRNTRFTDAGARALERELPGCEVRGPHNAPFGL